MKKNKYFDKLSKMDQFIYDETFKICSKCTSYDSCPFEQEGNKLEIDGLKGKTLTVQKDEYSERYKLQYVDCGKAPGWCNTKLINDSKYDSVVCSNMPEIMTHFKNKGQMYIKGPPGIGKTHFIHYLGKKYVNAGKNVRIDKVQNILADIKRRMNSSNEKFYQQSDQDNLVEELKKIDTLILDELGNEYHASGWGLFEIIFPILDYRYEHNKVTIVVSNHDPRDLGQIYEKVRGVHSSQIAPLISRLEDMGVIEYDGKNPKYWRNTGGLMNGE